ncbi:MAG: aminoglycoside phosphotransferase family protein [Thermomicrobiales bacterium]|nr:aminoglycoside phosphotransferase family protein [Thermomicrobiales bacterium]
MSCLVPAKPPRPSAIGARDDAALTDPEQVDADWLTARLRERDVLRAGRVASVELERFRAKPYSNLYLVRACYTHDPDTAPRSFVLKLGKAAATNAAARRRRKLEHLYYAAIAPGMADPPSPAVYAVAHDPERGSFHLLMADLTESHDRPPRGLPPTLEQAGASIDALAHVHAAWWNDRRAIGGCRRRDAGWTRRKTETARAAISELLESHGDRLAPGMRDALGQVGENYPALLALADPFTVVHGDAHPWNALTPVAGGPAVLVDWEGWSVDAPAGDLAAFIALRFDPDLRRHTEGELLRRYLTALQARGVRDYHEPDLARDYRRAVARRVLSPVFAWRRGADNAAWWNNLARITLAYHDLDCGEALRG